MAHRLSQTTLSMVKAISKNRNNAKGRRLAIGVSANQVLEIAAAFDDLFEISCTAEVLAKDALKHLANGCIISGEAEALRMRIHSHNIIDEMKAVAGADPEKEKTDV